MKYCIIIGNTHFVFKMGSAEGAEIYIARFKPNYVSNLSIDFAVT